MRKARKILGRNTSRRVPRVVLATIVITVFALGATAAMKMQRGQAKGAQAPPPHKLAGNKDRANLIRLAGQQNDTGQIRPLTQEEAQRLAEGIRELVNPSSEGLKQVKQADGSVSVDLEGRFQNVVLARKSEDGVAQACVDNRPAAAAFLGIDPELMKDSPKTGSSPKQPASGIGVKIEVK